MSLLARILAVPVENYRIGVALLGTKDGANQTFTTAETFVHLSGGLTIAVYLNGQRLVEGDDYTVSGPSSEVGSTVTTLLAPVATDKLHADYIVSS